MSMVDVAIVAGSGILLKGDIGHDIADNRHTALEVVARPDLSLKGQWNWRSFTGVGVGAGQTVKAGWVAQWDRTNDRNSSPMPPVLLGDLEVAE